MLNQVPRHEDIVWGSEGIAPLILKFGSRWRWSASPPGRFAHGERAPVTIGYEAGWAPESFWTQWQREKVLAPTGNGTPVVEPVT
jgi:hypothetical protein